MAVSRAQPDIISGINGPWEVEDCTFAFKILFLLLSHKPQENVHNIPADCWKQATNHNKHTSWQYPSFLTSLFQKKKKKKCSEHLLSVKLLSVTRQTVCQPLPSWVLPSQLRPVWFDSLPLNFSYSLLFISCSYSTTALMLAGQLVINLNRPATYYHSTLWLASYRRDFVAIKSAGQAACIPLSQCVYSFTHSHFFE